MAVETIQDTENKEANTIPSTPNNEGKEIVVRDVNTEEINEANAEETNEANAEKTSEVSEAPSVSVEADIKGKEISDDIEKDINIDVNICNNSSCSLQYISYITVNYYNNDDHLRRTNTKNQT